MRNTHSEQMFSALPLITDINDRRINVRFVPEAEMNLGEKPSLI
jgi:hypothetical protein